MDVIPDKEETTVLCALAREGFQASQTLAAANPTRLERRRLERAVEEGHKAEAVLVAGHGRLINYLCSGVIRSIGLTDVPYDDLYQEACIGFLHAVRNYDPSRGSLSNYATWRVRDQIQAFVRGNSGLSGKTAGTLLVSLRRYIPLMEEKLGRGPTPNELTDVYNETTLLRYQAIAANKPGGDKLNDDELRAEGIRQMRRRGVWLSVERVEALLRRQQGQVSLDAPVFRDEVDSDSEADFLASDHDVADEAVDNVAQEHLAAGVAQAIEVLEAEFGSDVATVIQLRFGIDDGEPRGVSEIAKEMNLSVSQVRKLMNQGLGALRETLQDLVP